MNQFTTPSGAGVIICSGPDELARRGASAIADAIIRKRSGRISVALSGGSTPKPVYQHLAAEYRDAIPWQRVLLFWGDERFVPPDSPHSNYRMTREALIDRIRIPAANIHPVPTDLPDPGDAARQYELALRRELGEPSPALDLLLLGLGDDGHTASLFPGSPALQEMAHDTAVAQAPAEPRTRITLTLPMIGRAREIIFLVSGRGKHAPLRAILDTPETARTLYPAGMIHPAGTMLWIVDREAYEG